MGRTADAYEKLSRDVADAPTPEAARAEIGQLQELFGDPKNVKAAREFAAAIEEGGYDLGIGPGSSTLPGQTPVP